MDLEPIQEFDTPFPRRYCWLVRLMIGYLVFIAAMVGVWFWWDATTTNRLNAEIDRLHTDGQPALASDFAAQPRITDAGNAALHYKQAWNLAYNADQTDFDNNIDLNIRLTPKMEATLRTFPLDFAANLREMRQARQYSEADFGVKFTTTLTLVSLSYLNSVRELANLASYSARASHLDSNDAEAIENVRDVLHMAALLDKSGITIVDHLVAIGCIASACRQTDFLAEEMAIESSVPSHRQAASSPTTHPARPASRAQVKAVIADLLDDRPIQQGLENALKGERAGHLDMARYVTTPGPNNIARAGMGVNMPGTTLLWPTFRMSGIRLSRRMTQRLEAAQAETTYLSAGKRLPNTERQWSNHTSLTGASILLEKVLEPGTGRFFELHFRILTERRASAIKLAIRLYQLDHVGRFPTSLDELVPTYLPSIPTDPFGDGIRPMSYTPRMEVDGVTTPVIYSVSTDGIDGKASTRPTSPRGLSYEQTVRERPGEREDLLFPLISPPLLDPPPPEVQDPATIDPALTPATTEPSPQADDHQP